MSGTTALLDKSQRWKIFILFILSILFVQESYSGSFSDLSYCDGDWHQQDSLLSSVSTTISTYGNYALNASRTSYDPKNALQTFANFAREACPAQQAAYTCYYTQPDKRQHWEMLERRQYIPHNTSTCHPFTPHKFLHLLKNRRLLLLGDSVMGQTWESLVCALYNLPGLTTHLFTYFSHQQQQQHSTTNSHNRKLLAPRRKGPTKVVEQKPLHGHIVSGYLAIKEFNVTISYTGNDNIHDTVRLYRLHQHDIVIMNIGSNVNELLSLLREGIEKLYEGKTHNGGMNRNSTSSKVPMILIAESTPEHYQTNNGYYTDDSSIRKAGCVMSKTKLEYDEIMNVRSDDWRNLALHTVMEPLVREKIVSIIPVNRPLQTQYDAHIGGGGDCTHRCYPSGIQKYIHLMYYNAIRRRLIAEAEKYGQDETSIELTTYQDIVVSERPRHDTSKPIEDLTWRLHPTLHNGEIVCLFKQTILQGCYRIERGYLRPYDDYITLKQLDYIDFTIDTSWTMDLVKAYYPKVRVFEQSSSEIEYVIGEMIRLNYNIPLLNPTAQPNVANLYRFDSRSSNAAVLQRRAQPTAGFRRYIEKPTLPPKKDKEEQKLLKKKMIEDHHNNAVSYTENRKFGPHFGK